MTSPTLIVGRLEPFCEMGTEGVVWSIVQQGLPGYEGLFGLENGDDLRIYGPNGTVAWEGTIRWQATPRWSHGAQAGLDPEAWGRVFYDECPAVARLQRTTRASEVAIVQDVLPHDPMAAWDALSRQPDVFKRVSEGLEYLLNYRGRRWGWPPRTLATDAEKARAWRCILAMDNAERALWMPGAKPFQLAGRRWPRPDAFTDAEQAAWARHRLPHDGWA